MVLYLQHLIFIISTCSALEQVYIQQRATEIHRYNNIQLPYVCIYEHIYIATYIKLQTYIHNTNFTHTTTNTDLRLHAAKNSNHGKMITIATVKLALSTLLHSNTLDPS